MQFIQSIILIVVTTIVTNLFTRKLYISDKDRIIKEKQFKIYEGLYINIVKNRVNEPILPCLAKKNIYHLINTLITNWNLSYFASYQHTLPNMLRNSLIL